MLATDFRCRFRTAENFENDLRFEISCEGSTLGQGNAPFYVLYALSPLSNFVGPLHALKLFNGLAPAMLVGTDIQNINELVAIYAGIHAEEIKIEYHVAANHVDKILADYFSYGLCEPLTSIDAGKIKSILWVLTDKGKDVYKLKAVEDLFAKTLTPALTTSDQQ